MKKITLTSLCLVALLFLSACVSESVGVTSNTNSTNTNVSSSSTAPTATVDNPPSSPTTQETVTPITSATASWHRVYMHYDLLQGQPHEWGEISGQLSLNLAENAYEGAYSMRLESSHAILPKQLITYRGSDNDYYTTTIQSINGNTINLATPLKKNVWYGENAWNFYYNPTHPNYRGYLAIADFAIRSLGRGNLNYGRHALLGDSWFSDGTIRDRLAESLSNATFLNLGIGGNTSNDLLERFDADVTPANPDFVWILTGTNDYWTGVSTQQYKQNIQLLISKIEALGAKPVIIDPSVGALNYGSSNITYLSHAYTDAIEQIYNDYDY